MNSKMMLKKKKSLIGISLLFLCLVLFIQYNNLNQNPKENQIQKNLNLSGIVPHSNLLWNENPNFEDPIQPTWFSEIKGDLADVNATTSSGQANFEFLGEARIFNQVSGIPKPEDSWEALKNSYFILPDYYEINNRTGCMANHTYDESVDQSRNRPSVHWKRNITMPVDMTEYIITSASLSAIINGSANRNLETPTDSFSGFATFYDHAIFYFEISDLENKEPPRRIASYKTEDLGKDGPGSIDYLNDTYITHDDEEDLIFYLNQVFEYDPYNFTIILGIDIYTEDNYNFFDLDIFYSLLIKSCNLTFTYEKKMDSSTYVSWNQELREINGTNVEITKANLKVKYKIDQNWTSASENSKIKILINNREHKEYIQLIDYIYSPSFQEAKPDGYDLMEYDIMYPYEKMNLSIQVFLAEDFGLDQKIVISITDVYLIISYIENEPDIFSEPGIFLLLLIIGSIIAASLGGYLIAYQKVLKYPKPVRKVRKYRRSLNNEDAPHKTIREREKAFDETYQKELKKAKKILKSRPILKSEKYDKIGKNFAEIKKETLLEKSIDQSTEQMKKNGGIN